MIELPVPVRLLYGLGFIEDAAQKIDHAQAPPAPVPEAATPEHGRYVAQMCVGCHGAGFAGGRIPGGPPQWPPASNLTSGEGSALTRYPDASAFAAMLKSGRRPDGATVSSVMPFEALAALSATDVEAMYLYFRSLPARPWGQR